MTIPEDVEMLRAFADILEREDDAHAALDRITAALREKDEALRGLYETWNKTPGAVDWIELEKQMDRVRALTDGQEPQRNPSERQLLDFGDVSQRMIESDRLTDGQEP